MKKSILVLSLLAATQYGSAQITLSASGYTSSVAGTTDTLKFVTLSSLPALTTGAAQTWDFTGISYDSTFYRQHSSVPTGAFSATAQYADSVWDSTGYTYYYHQNNAKGIAAPGLLAYGEQFDQQKIPMGAWTSNPADTFTILSQDAVFSNPIRDITFPATYPAHWADTAHVVIHGKMTIPDMQFLDSAFEFHYQYHTYDTVKGWGTLKIKNSAGVVTNIEVLQVKSTILRNDSTIIAGSVISEYQHDYMSLSGGGEGTASYEYKYYAANEVTPIVDVLYQPYFFTTPQQAVILSKNFLPATGVAEITAPENMAVYPNPVSGRVFYISVPKENGTGTYDIINAAGQLIIRGKLSNQSICRVELPERVISGTYYVRITDDNKQVSIHKLIVE